MLPLGGCCVRGIVGSGTEKGKGKQDHAGAFYMQAPDCKLYQLLALLLNAFLFPFETLFVSFCKNNQQMNKKPQLSGHITPKGKAR